MSELINTSNRDVSKELAEPIAGPVDNVEIISEHTTTSPVAEDALKKSKVAPWKKMAVRSSYALLVAGGVYTAAHTPFHELKQDVERAAPVMIPAAVVSESMFIGGIAIATAGLGHRVGNPLKLNSETVMADVTRKDQANRLIKTGVNINTIGALGTAAVIGVGAVAYLPAETWPGAAGIALADVASTLAIRAPIYAALRKNRETIGKQPKVNVRHANLDDIDRLADLDLELFEGAYGEKKPEKAEVIEMLTKRLNNCDGWMFVGEVEGQVEGFVSAFRTDKSAEDFVSWEESTANGTLEGKVKPNGRYVYVANMTIGRKAMKGGGKEMLLANLFANAIEAGGIEYGYFESRMPGFKTWLNEKGLNTSVKEELQMLAEQYAGLKNDDGEAFDKQLRMYEKDGFKRGEPVADAFEDESSMGFGVVFKADLPTRGKIDESRLLRSVAAKGLRFAAKKPARLAFVEKYL